MGLKKISNENIEKRINKGRGRTNYPQKKTVNNSITSLSETVQSVPAPRNRGRTQLPGRKDASGEIPNQRLGVTQRKNTIRIKIPQVEGNKDHDDKSTKELAVKSIIGNQGDNDGRLRSRDPARAFLGKAATRVPEVVTENIGAKKFKVVQDVKNDDTFFIGNSQEVIGSKTNRVATDNYQDYAVVNRERISPKTVQENQISRESPENIKPVQHKGVFEKEKKINQDNEDSENLKYVENSNNDYDYDYDYVEFESVNKKRVKPVIDALIPDVTTTTTIPSIRTKSPHLNNENKLPVTTSTQDAQVNKNFRKDFEFKF